MSFLLEMTKYKYADFAQKMPEVGIPRTSSSTIPDATQKMSRIPRVELEKLYMSDAQTFKMINSYKHLLLQAGYRIVADNKTNQKQYDDFFKNIGQIGLHYKLNDLLGRIILDACLYGHAYVEKVYDTTGRYIVDLKPIDAKIMDYVRDWKYVMMTDLEQNPLGFVMNTGYYTDAITDKYPNGSRILPGYIFLRPERIAQFILNPVGNGFEGLGIVEPAYTQITRKMKIEEAASNAVYNAADNLIYAIVGDTNRSASAPLMNATLETLRNWTTNRRAVFQYPTDIKSMPIEQSPQVQELLHYLRQDQSAAGGMSLSMAIGGGESNNKSTMNTERRDFNTKLNSVAMDIAQQFTHNILDAIYEVNGYGSKAIMKWNNVSTDDKSDIVTQLTLAVDKSAITPKELRMYLKNVYDLETDDEDWQRAQKALEMLPTMPNQTPGSALDDDKSEDTPSKTEVKSSKNPLATKKNIAKSKDNYEANRQ